MLKILIADKMSDDARAILAKNGIDVTVKTGMKEDELTKEIVSFDGLIIRSASKATRKVIEAGTKLKVIGRAGIGVDNIDIPAATERGVIVMNTPTGNVITTAEHALAMLFATARQIPYASETMHQKKWEKSAFKGSEISGKVLGVIGSGNIGSIVVNRAIGLKMKVIIADPFLSAKAAEDKGARLVTLDDLYKEADFITIHTPLTDSTKNIINKDAISKMKKGVRIVNCARGGIVNEADLAQALKSGQVASAALDVFANEPLEDGSPLHGISTLVMTPHLGASTVEAQERVAAEIAEQISNFLLAGTVNNAVNFISLDEKTSKSIAPFQNLSFTLGKFIGQIVESGFNDVTIEYEGRVNQFPLALLNQWVLYGMQLNKVEQVNFINSLMVAKERGISVKEVKREDDNVEYQNLITVKVVTDKRKYLVSGTLLGQNVRVVAINGVALESELSTNNIYIENKDKPGLVSNLSGLLAKKNINIGTFHLGRSKTESYAIALVGIDSEVDDKLLGEIVGLPLVQKAKYLRF